MGVNKNTKKTDIVSVYNFNWPNVSKEQQTTIDVV